MVERAKLLHFFVISINFQKKCTKKHHFLIFCYQKVTILKESVLYLTGWMLGEYSLAIDRE